MPVAQFEPYSGALVCLGDSNNLMTKDAQLLLTAFSLIENPVGENAIDSDHGMISDRNHEALGWVVH